MELDKIDNTPIIKTVDLLVQDGLTIFLVAIEYENAIQVSVYDNIPRLGSLSLAYPLKDIVNVQVIFSGRDESYASAIAQILAKKKNKMVYGSVFLERNSVVSLDILKSLIDKYLEK
ncbi:MAG: hypothetical protein GPJ54_20005 [Candidatus Heimdallarchaeota archaeon]|nr:hypothetical protein [Candidatus Heimdallarchaeota archaeon]